MALLELDLADWRRVVEANLTSAFVVGRAVARGMVARGRGKIINVGSVQSDLARPTIAPYTATKGGIRGTSPGRWRQSGAAAGMQANAIAPGYIHTEMTQALVDDAAFNAWVVGPHPGRPLGSQRRTWSGPRCGWPPAPPTTSTGRRSSSTAA